MLKFMSTTPLTAHCTPDTDTDSDTQLIPCHGTEHGAHRAFGKDQMLAGLGFESLQLHDDPPVDSNKSRREANSAWVILPEHSDITNGENST